MSAEELGRGLIGEVEVEGLDELLSTLRTFSHSGPSRHFGIPELDALMPVIEPPSLPLPQPHTEPWERSVQRADQSSTVKKRASKGTVIELLSAGPGQGKTHLLYYITAIAVLPPTFEGVNLNGKNSAIVMLDADSRFDVQRLVEVMAHYISSKLKESTSTTTTTLSFPPGPSEETIKAIRSLITTSLSHIHIFRPQSHASLIATLSHLPAYLFNTKAHNSTHRPIHSIILDSASAFFWQIRANAEPSSKPSSSTNDSYAVLVRHLTTLSRTFSCAIIATTWALSSASTIRSNLPPAWASFPTVRLAVRRVPVAPFAAAMSVEEALVEKGQRGEVVERGRFEVWKVGSGDGFGFRITGEGVSVERVEG